MATLYDFLYIDNERVKSLYAQLFSGLLDAIDEMASESHTKSSEGQAGGSPVGHLGHGRASTEQESRLDRIDPHDLILRDVLQELSQQNFIKSDTKEAQPGNIVLLNGKVSILNFESYRYFIDVLPRFMEPETEQKQMQQSKNQRKQQQKKKKKEIEDTQKLLKLVSDVVPWGIQVILEHADITAWGAIDGNNLRDPSGNLMLKHGPTLVGEWYILGIVDALEDQFGESSEVFPETISGLIDASNGIREGFGRPSGFIGITPLIIFRKLF